MRKSSTESKREHDYRQLGWGHNIEMLKRIGDTDQYSACIFGTGLQEGETLLMKMQSGKDARWRFVEVKPFYDPPDMYKVVIEPVEYL